LSSVLPGLSGSPTSGIGLPGININVLGNELGGSPTSLLGGLVPGLSGGTCPEEAGICGPQSLGGIAGGMCPQELGGMCSPTALGAANPKIGKDIAHLQRDEAKLQTDLGSSGLSGAIPGECGATGIPGLGGLCGEQSPLGGLCGEQNPLAGLCGQNPELSQLAGQPGMLPHHHHHHLGEEAALGGNTTTNPALVSLLNNSNLNLGGAAGLSGLPANDNILTNNSLDNLVNQLAAH
jgi:hypothetical protein